jgi:hypothetical protein
VLEEGELRNGDGGYALAAMDRGLAVAATATGVTPQGGLQLVTLVLTRT